MAATNLITVGSGAATSADVELADGETATVGLKAAESDDPMPHGGQVVIELKDDAGEYWPVGRLTVTNRQTVIAGAGTYRLRRVANGVTVGAFRG